MICLDTSFLIDLIKGGVDVESCMSGLSLTGQDITIASPSVFEIVRGLYLSKNKRNVNDEELVKIESLINSFKILSLEKRSAVIAGKIDADLRNSGSVIGLTDVMIGAICLQNNEKLLTRNVKHFKKIRGLKVLGY